jgi:hypothetical protein
MQPEGLGNLIKIIHLAHTKFHKKWFKHSKVDLWEGDSKTHRQLGDI